MLNRLENRGEMQNCFHTAEDNRVMRYNQLCAAAGGRTKTNQNNEVKEKSTVQVCCTVLGWSGLRVSNSPPTAWEAVTLPDELNPHRCV